MKKIKRTGILLSVYVGIVLLFAIPYYSMSFSKNLVIRRTIFLSGYPVAAFTTDVQNTAYSKDEEYGECYHFHANLNSGTENAIPGICMKKNKYGMYYNVTIGAG